MMTKQLPDVRSDKGYQEEARLFAMNLMQGKGVVRLCKDFTKIAEWMEEVLAVAYLYGAQSAIGIGYRLADRDWEDTVRMYKKQLEERQ